MIVILVSETVLIKTFC